MIIVCQDPSTRPPPSQPQRTRRTQRRRGAKAQRRRGAEAQRGHGITGVWVVLTRARFHRILPTEHTEKHRRTDNDPSVITRRSRRSIAILLNRKDREERKGAKIPMNCRVLLCDMARSWPSDGQVSLGQETVPNTSIRPGFLAQRPAQAQASPPISLFKRNGEAEPTCPLHVGR